MQVNDLDNGDRYQDPYPYYPSSSPHVQTPIVQVSQLQQASQSSDFTPAKLPRSSLSQITQINIRKQLSVLIESLNSMLTRQTSSMTDFETPLEVEHGSIKAKLEYTRNLIQAVAQILSMSKFERTEYSFDLVDQFNFVDPQFIKSLKKVKEDIFTRLLAENDQGLLMRKEETKLLSMLLLGSFRDFPSDEMERKIASLKKQFKNRLQAINECMVQVNAIYEKKEALEEANSQLKQGIRESKQHLSVLESSISDTLEEGHEINREVFELRIKLIEKRNQIENRLHKSRRPMSLKLPINQTPRKNYVGN